MVIFLCAIDAQHIGSTRCFVAADSAKHEKPSSDEQELPRFRYPASLQLNPMPLRYWSSIITGRNHIEATDYVICSVDNSLLQETETLTVQLNYLRMSEMP